MKDHVHERIGFREIDEHGNAVQAVSPHVPEPVEPDRKRLTLNPFIIALWALDAGLAWCGLWALTSAVGAMMGLTSAQSAETAQVNFIMLSHTPYALLAVVLITAALLFWHAVQWQKKRPTK
ncbi:hypothetical protein J2Y66_001352 [Paenarthrobacter nitroguajacolicus]|uniref:hypothetical protein n=1 Tax=Paenarthrobacter nitroguajacolicus TaxID=211146 RepID=UPI0028550FEC|nr:hypothetical protein [Paenarthrobacter nitroguajacolicus]MDR6986882.1 hypothetical protein [Paenarthrobacter nitroguajacolicus]